MAARLLAVLWAALWLTACGGGGSSDEEAAPAGEAPSDYYLWNVASSNWGYWHWLAVVDPARPGTPKHSILMTAADGSPAMPRSVGGTRLDPVNQRITQLGTTRLFYLQQGRVHTLDLAIRHDAAPKQLSSITDGCWIWNTYPLDAAGEDTWAVVETAGADGRCDDYFDNTYAGVRTTMNAATPAMALPGGLPHAMLVLPDEHGRALGLLVHTGNQLRLYDTDLAHGTTVAGGEAITAIWQVGLLAGERKLYLGVWPDGGSQRSLRVLSYSGQAATLGAELMTFESPQAASARGDWDTHYFADGRRLYKLTGGGPTLLTSFGAGDVQQITPTAHHLVVRLRDAGSSTWSTWSVAKAGGAPRDLATAESGMNGSAYEGVVHWGTVAGDRYFFFSQDAHGLGSIYSVDADGRHAQTWASGVAYAGVLARATPAAGQWGEQISDVIYCVPLAGRTDCDGGTMQQLNAATQVTTTLGTLPRSGKASRTLQYTFAWGFAGDSFSIGAQLYDSGTDTYAYDLFTATAGRAGSLQASTYNYAAP